MRLPYDVRAVMYRYLEPNALPPLAPSFNSPGFYLSCRQAQQELEELAQNGFTEFLDHWKATTSAHLNLNTSPNKPRNITITIPFSALHKHPDKILDRNRLSWTKELLHDLQPLFAKHFNLIRIHIGTRNPNDTVPEYTTLISRGRVEVSMHKLLRDLAYMIEHMNAFGSESDVARVSLATILPYAHGEPVEYFAPKKIQTRRICLSWDLRDNIDVQDVVLNGKLYQSCNRGRASYTVEALARRASVEETLSSNVIGTQDGDPAWRPRTVFYHVRDNDRLMGQMCLQSYRRWTPCEDGHFVNETLNALECTEEYVSCKGLEGDVERGLRRIDNDMFERSEREVEAALWSV
jgi:hypothetical protein